jgi:osmoprotectant transport system permease protein
MFAQVLEDRGIRVERRPGLGATEVAFAALRSGAIDVYPEYTGTGLIAILHDTSTSDAQSAFGKVARAFAEKYSVHWLAPLGFENTYAIAVTKAVASKYNLRTLSDLSRAAPSLVAGLTPDFIGRADGLPALQRKYGMRFRQVTPLSQALKYQALAAGSVEVIDGYSTDGLIKKYDLVVLIDDAHVFPPYEAAAMVGARLWKTRPDAVSALSQLSGRIDAATMRALNARVEVDHEPLAGVAHSALMALGIIGPGPVTQDHNAPTSSFGEYLSSHRAELTSQFLRHVMLVLAALILGILVAVPLGLVLERSRGSAESVIRGIGVLQTIPSIALLAFMIPLFGIGVRPALVALWLYSLYPILRATYTGVRDAHPPAVYAAHALGMTGWQLLRYVRFPLATPVIMSGIRTAAVITVGTATLAAFVGAGGLGEPIATGLALADNRMILSGALPAAVLALVADGLLALVERAVMPCIFGNGRRPRLADDGIPLGADIAAAERTPCFGWERSMKAGSQLSSLLFSILSLGLGADADAQSRVQQSTTVSVDVEVPFAPIPVRAMDRTHLVYELHITNFGRTSLTLAAVDVFADDPAQAQLAAYRDSEIIKRLAVLNYTDPAQGKQIIAGGQRGVLFLLLTVDPSRVPISLRHRLTFTIAASDSAAEQQVVDGVRVTVQRSEPLAIGSPLRGRWVAGNGLSNDTGHRSLIAIGGHVRIAQRFATDWVGMGTDGLVARNGDLSQNGNYYGYGAQAIAVADGLVSETKDGIPENAPQTKVRAVPITLETIAGNHVILDLGHGHFALYAHLQPQSIRVKTGEKVRAGQVLGLVGNSGNSDLPHLHFQLMDASSALGSEGLPYVLKSFELEGVANTPSEFVKGGYRPRSGAASTRRMELPVQNAVVELK